MDEIKIGAEQELYLAPETEKLENAEEIAEISLDAEKYPFIIGYDANEKENIMTELEKLGCYEIKQLDFANCIAVFMSMAQLKAIKTLAGVEIVEKDYDYKCLINNVNESEYALYLTGEKTYSNSETAIKLAVFDTGISKALVNGSVNFVNDNSEDENGHGTQMVGIISSVVANAENKVVSPSIYSLAAADNRGFAKTSTIMQALDWSINNGIKIVCMSLGDYHKSALLEKMINRASDAGIVMVAAVGNDGGFEDENRLMYPAAFDNVLSVGAKNGDTIADYSNGGEKADCFANGSQSTTDINGNAVNVIGTSGAAAYVAGTILKNWCINPEKTSVDIIADIKTEMSFSAGIDMSANLTATPKNDIINEKDNTDSSVTEPNVRSLHEDISVLCVGNDCDEGCSSNDMASAISLPFLNWRSGSITCPGNEVWYKFTANASGVHPNGSPGWYTVHTQGSLDTVGYLYDSYGDQIAYNDDGDNGLNFNFWAQLDYYETYYIRVKAFGSNTGNFDIRVSYHGDDHGNTPETATEVVGVYYQDKSVTGYLHSQADVDYYTFVPARNCVMEIYTEGDTNTYGRLYCASGGLLDSDNNSNGNGNFKITAHLEAMKRYYIAVSHNSSTGYGDYTLRFKFVKDMLPVYSNPKGAVWINDSYDKDEVELSVQKIVYMDNQDSILWGYKLQQSTFINTIKIKAQQSIDELIEELILQGFSTSFAYNMAGYIIDILEILQPSLNLAEFNSAYDSYVDSGYIGFVIAQCWTLKRMAVPPIPVYEYIEQQTYAHYDNDNYMYGYPYARGHFEYC